MRQKHILAFSWLWWSLAGASLLIKGTQVASKEMITKAFVAGLILGSLKYFLIIRKTSNRLIKHIREQAEPILLKNIYPLRFYPIITIMIVFAMCIKYIGIPNDTLAIIDFTVAIALVNGGSDFLKEVLYPKKVIFK